MNREIRDIMSKRLSHLYTSDSTRPDVVVYVGEKPILVVEVQSSPMELALKACVFMDLNCYGTSKLSKKTLMN